MKHLLVTNDFPPKFGGIQAYLWELWRRLPGGEAAVLTTGHPGAAAFDADQDFPIERHGRVLLPTPQLARRINALAARHGAELVVLDPALPLALVASRLNLPYAVVVHGAEVALPARVPGVASLLKRVLRGAEFVVAAGDYVAREAAALAPHRRVVNVPPGIDVHRFAVPTDGVRAELRNRWELRPEHEVVLHLSRLVPRKGADVLIRAAAALAPARPDLVVLVAGGGRDESRLRKLAARLDAPVRFVGRVPETDKPGLYGACDVFAHVCRNRWMGLEQEGFGIIFLEAAACGAPTIAGASGGAADAVVDGETGVVIDPPTDVAKLASTLDAMLRDRARTRAWGVAGRDRVVASFDYDVLARALTAAMA